MTIVDTLNTALTEARALIAERDALKARVAELEATPTPTSGPSNRSWGFAPTSWMLLWPKAATDLDRDLDLLAGSGSRWLRFDFDWQSAEPVKGQPNWSFIDRVVAAASARGVRILATVAYSPAWARPAGTTDKVPPTNLADYTNFVKACVGRYAPKGVRHWEIWNEPNIVPFWQPKPDPVKYTAMLKQAYAAVKNVDPTATVISAGLAPAGDSSDGLHVSPRTFITRMYANGVKGSFDALGMHPYAFPYGITAAGDWNQWYSLPKTFQLLEANGDGSKKIWATEYGAPTGIVPNRSVTEATQAKFVSDAWNAWQQWPWTGPLFWYSLRNSGTNQGDIENMFGLVRNDFSLKPAYSTFKSLGVAP